jgi:glycosyltransferase involved in cell wall biosynthesis
MNVCVYTENHLKGGVDTFLINLMNAWPNSTDSLTLLCNASHPGLETISQKVRVTFSIRKYRRLYASKLAAGQDRWGIGRIFIIRAFFVLSYRLIQYPILFPWYVGTLFFHFRKSEYERLIVVNGGYPASLLCRSAIVAWNLSGKPKRGVLNFHNSVPKANTRINYFENLIDVLVSRSSLYIVSVTQNCLDSISERPAFQSIQNLRVIHNGIEDPLNVELSGGGDDEELKYREPFLLMLATYEPRKGLLFLLDAFQIIHPMFPNLILRVYGYDVENQKKSIQAKIDDLGLSSYVELNDFTHNTQALLRKAKILVAPSQEHESFNLTIIEAMANGVPVVVTDVGGMPEVLGNSGAGFISHRNDSAEFAANIVSILESTTIESSMRRKGRQTYERHYKADKMASSYRALLE